MTPFVVEELWRYPVKSLLGERVQQVEIGEHGLAGDRSFGLLDTDSGKVLTARRCPELLFASSRWVAGEAIITAADGSQMADDAALSAWLGRAVRLIAASEDSGGTFETPVDAEEEDAQPWAAWTGPAGSFHDSGRSRVSLVGRATLRDWDARRFRANVVLSDGGEDDLVGRHIQLGQARIDVLKRIDRCVMVTRPQVGLDRDLSVLKTIAAERDLCLAIGGNVTVGGQVAVGDQLSVVPNGS